MPAKQTSAPDGDTSRPKHTPAFRGRPVDVVIDVRSRLEFWLGHLQGATCIPVHALAARLPDRREIRTDSRIMVYCASGARSAVAAGLLKSLGYRHVTDAGAMSAATRHYAP